jgi:hypothetical protein
LAGTLSTKGSQYTPLCVALDHLSASLSSMPPSRDSGISGVHAITLVIGAIRAHLKDETP